MEYAIEVENLSKVYFLYEKPIDRLWESLSLRRKSHHKDFHALDPISFQIQKGSCFGIIGVNGSGKSTLLKMITGVLNPTTGSVKVNGKVSALLELGAGFNMEFTGIENIYLNGTVMGYTKAEIEAKIPEIEAFADIGEFIRQPVKTYSSGMFARLAFAVAINVDPDILIVDEALSVGDIYFQSKCFRKFDEFKKKGKTIIFVTHDMGSVLNYCDDVIVLNKGSLMGRGDAPSMVDLYKRILANQSLEDVSVEEEPKEEKTVVEAPFEAGWKEHLALNPKPSVYGDHKAEIIDFAIIDHKGHITNTVLKGEPFQIKVAIRLHEDLPGLISTMTVKNNQGVALMGTNTFLEGVSLDEAKQGDVAIVTFNQVMHLQPGQYLLSISATRYQNDEVHVFHRLYDVVSIDVIGTKTTVGFFDPDTKVDVSIKK